MNQPSEDLDSIEGISLPLFDKSIFVSSKSSLIVQILLEKSSKFNNSFLNTFLHSLRLLSELSTTPPGNTCAPGNDLEAFGLLT